jgi:molecular chaperone Hsp33
LKAASGDHIVRAMTDEGSFRVVAARSTETVTGVLAHQQVKGSTARHLADLTTGTILIRETMSPALRVQGILKRSDQRGYLLADSHPSGQARALVGLSEQRDDFALENGVLQMVRSLQDGRIHQGVVAVPEQSDVSGALMSYMQESEQITTMIVVSTLLAEEKVRAAGGYVVQLLPGAKRDLLAIMTERLEDFRNIEPFLTREDFSPHLLVEELLYGMTHTLLEDTKIQAGCWCSHASMMGALSSISRADIQEMVDDGKVIEIQCDYCRRDFRVSPAQLRGLLNDN